MIILTRKFPAYNKLGITLVFICHLFVAMKMLNFYKSQQNHMLYKNTLNAPHSVIAPFSELYAFSECVCMNFCDVLELIKQILDLLMLKEYLFSDILR